VLALRADRAGSRFRPYIYRGHSPHKYLSKVTRSIRRYTPPFTSGLTAEKQRKPASYSNNFLKAAANFFASSYIFFLFDSAASLKLSSAFFA
jgi:hypothetical protein